MSKYNSRIRSLDRRIEAIYEKINFFVPRKSLLLLRDYNKSLLDEKNVSDEDLQKMFVQINQVDEEFLDSEVPELYPQKILELIEKDDLFNLAFDYQFYSANCEAEIYGIWVEEDEWKGFQTEIQQAQGYFKRKKEAKELEEFVTKLEHRGLTANLGGLDALPVSQETSSDTEAAIATTAAETTPTHPADQDETALHDAATVDEKDQIAFKQFFQALRMCECAMRGLPIPLPVPREIQNEIQWFYNNFTVEEIRSFCEYATTNPEQLNWQRDPVTLNTLTRGISQWKATGTFSKSIDEQSPTAIKACAECDDRGKKKTSINGRLVMIKCRHLKITQVVSY